MRGRRTPAFESRSEAGPSKRQAAVAAPPADYRSLGEYVARLLGSAEAAAETIRIEARREAAWIRRNADEDAASQSRGAQKHHHMADIEVHQIAADAQAEADSIVAIANQKVEEVMSEVRPRQEKLRLETRSLKEARELAIRRLRDVAAQLEALLAQEPRSPKEEGRPRESHHRRTLEDGLVDAAVSAEERSFAERRQLGQRRRAFVKSTNQERR